MKKLFSVLLAVLLLASLCGSAFAAVDTDEGIWKATESGFEMQIPDALRDAKGYITFSDGGEGMDPGSGLVVALTNYICMPWEEYNALAEAQVEAYENDDMEKLTELIETMNQTELDFFRIYGINKGRGEEELRTILIDQDVRPEYFDGDEELMAAVTALYENLRMRELGEKDGLRYYLCWFDPEEYLSFTDMEQIDPVYLNEYRELLDMNEQLADSVSLTGGAKLADMAEAGTQLAFETTDLEGKPLSSEEIFAGHAITMINMWATWCDPCKDELPELAAMAEEFEKQGCQIIGMCLDAEDDETMAEGRAILEEAGVSYLNIVPFEGREEILPNKFYPTTYFVDENGVILDEIVIGAAVEQYPQSLAKLLAKQAAVS